MNQGTCLPSSCLGVARNTVKALNARLERSFERPWCFAGVNAIPACPSTCCVLQTMLPSSLFKLKMEPQTSPSHLKQRAEREELFARFETSEDETLRLMLVLHKELMAALDALEQRLRSKK